MLFGEYLLFPPPFKFGLYLEKENEVKMCETTRTKNTFCGGCLLEVKCKKRKSMLTLLVEIERVRVRVFSLEVTLERVCWPCKWKCGRGRVLEDESIYRQSLSCSRLQKRGTKIEVADVVVSTNHVVFLANRFPRLISLPTPAIFVSGTSGITTILKYRSVNPIRVGGFISDRCDFSLTVFISIGDLEFSVDICEGRSCCRFLLIDFFLDVLEF